MAANTSEVKKKYSIRERELGRGGYAIAYLLQRNDGNFFVRKVFDIKNEEDFEDLIDSFKLEVKVLRRAQSYPHIAQLHRAYLNRNRKKCFLDFEYYTEGDLFNYIEAKGLPLPTQRMFITHDIISGLVWLHQRRIVHGDLKEANIFLTRYQGEAFFRAVIGDFGLTFERDPQSETYIRRVLNPTLYPSLKFTPEEEKKVDPAWVDMFCFASILVAMIQKFHYPKIKKLSEEELDAGNYIQTNNYYLDNDGAEPEYLRLITACWDKNVKKIPNAVSVKSLIQNSSVFNFAFKNALNPESGIFKKHILPVVDEFYRVFVNFEIPGLTEKFIPLHETYHPPVKKMRKTYELIEQYMKNMEHQARRDSFHDNTVKNLLDAFMRLYKYPNFNAINRLEEALRKVNGASALTLRP